MGAESEPTEKPPETQNIKGDSTAENPPNPPPLPPAQDRPASDDDPNNEHKKLSKWEWFERVVKVIESVALIGGVATAFFIGYQWKEMRKASGDAEQALSLTGEQLKAMQTQSDVMQEQLDEMKRTRQLDERAWVTAFDFEPVNDDPNHYFRVTYKNTGKTPAINCDGTIVSQFDLKKIPKKDTRPPAPENAQLLAPDGSATITSLNIPFDQVNAIRNGWAAPYWYGTIWYDDIFGNHHWSQFCVRYDGKQTFAAPIHNSCDDAQTNQ